MRGRKVKQERVFRIRETKDWQGNKKFWPEYSDDGKEWIPTSVFWLTGSPAWVDKYNDAVKLIEHFKEGDEEKIHMNPELEAEKEEESSEDGITKEKDRICTYWLFFITIWQILVTVALFLLCN